MNLWISVLELLKMDFGYYKLTYSYVIVEKKFTGVWVVVFSCTRPCWVWGVTGQAIQSWFKCWAAQYWAPASSFN